jgi:hypothetical protein
MKLSCSACRTLPRIAVAALCAALLTLPVSADKNDKEFQTGTIFAAGHNVKLGDEGEHALNHVRKDMDNLIVEIDGIKYVGQYKKEKGIVGAGQYNFKEDDWPAGEKIEVRFERRHLLGIAATIMIAKRPRDGKQVGFGVVKKVDADGKVLCTNLGC